MDGTERRVLVVDDSPTARLALRRALEWPGSGLRVVGEAATARQTLRMLRELEPDVVTMDVYLGREDGVEITASIMKSRPRPIVIVTGISPGDPELAFRAMAVGALDVLAKPPAATHASYDAERKRLARTVRSLSLVPVVTRRSTSVPAPPDVAGRAPPPLGIGPTAVVVVGASTGGPPLLVDLLGSVPAPLGAPVVIVQHITEGFGEGFAAWLGDVAGHPTEYCTSRRRLTPGVVYVAADYAHLRFCGPDLIEPVAGPHRKFQRPSIDDLFESVPPQRAPFTLAVLLTGMGADGAEGLLALRQAGAFTVAQEPSTCAVEGMPASAIRLHAATEVMRPRAIAALLADVNRPAEAASVIAGG